MTELTGGAGDDFLVWATPDGVITQYTIIDGGAGIDLLFFQNDTEEAVFGGLDVIDLDQGLVFSAHLSEPVPIQNVENVSLRQGGVQILIGDDADNFLYGRHDDFRSGAGNDTIESFSRIDAVDGGAGTDTVILNGEYNEPLLGEDFTAVHVVEIDLGREIILSDGYLLGERRFAGVENIRLENQGISDISDELTGTPGRIVGSGAANAISAQGWENTMFGAGGKDTLDGGVDGDRLWGDEDNDSVLGNDGADSLKGGEGKDAISGGEGDDRLFGEAGRDTMTGGAGADRFVFRDGEADYAEDAAISFADRIADFSQAEGDLIDLRGIAGRPEDGFVFVSSAGFSGAAGELRAVTYSTGITMVFGDRDGDAVADLAIRIENGAIALTGADFLI